MTNNGPWSGVPRAQPERCPGAYDMHFYCKYDNPEHEFDEFPWESDQCQTRGEAISQIRRAGWIFHNDNTATCPKCVTRLKREKLA